MYVNIVISIQSCGSSSQNNCPRLKKSTLVLDMVGGSAAGPVSRAKRSIAAAQLLVAFIVYVIVRAGENCQHLRSLMNIRGDE